MNGIIEKKVEFSVESLSGTVSGDHLIAFQGEGHKLQRQQFIDQQQMQIQVQWGNFAFIAADNPRLANLMSQITPLTLTHEH